MPSSKKNRRPKMSIGQGSKKRQWKKLKQRRRAEVKTPAIKAAWDSSKTLQENMKSMGIALDANSVSHIQRNRFIPQTIEIGDLEEAKKASTSNNPVIEAMEIEASVGEKKKKFQISKPLVEFCKTLMNKYGENYKLMSKDRVLNQYQLTPSQMREKIREFKRCKTQYQKFLDEKKMLKQDEKPDVEMIAE